MDLSRNIKFNILVGLFLVSSVLLRFIFLNTSPDPFLLQKVGERISFEAEVVKEPDERDNSVRYVVELTPSKSASKILLVSHRFPKFNYGDKIRVSGKLELPKNFKNKSGTTFDYISYLSKDNIHFLIYQPEIEFIKSGGSFIFKNLFGFKNFFIEKIIEVIPEPNASFINSLIFGVRQSLGEDLLEKMKNVGLIHIVVVSGYNITLIASGILYAFSYLNRRKLGLFLSAVFIILFAIMVGLGSTVLRASIMAVIAMLARFLGRPYLALRALFVAIFTMLLFNPLILTRDPSFQLSAMATLGLILFSPIIYDFISNCKLRYFIPEKTGFREIVSSTFAVQLFLLPLLVKVSGIFSLISFLVNLIVLPLVPLTMILGFLTGVSGIFGKIISWPFGALSYLLTEFIIKISEIGNKIPFAYTDLDNIPVAVVLFSYLFYGFLFWKLRKKGSLSSAR